MRGTDNIDKKEVSGIAIILFIVFLLGLQLINTNLSQEVSDFWRDVTGFVVTGSSTANVTIASIAPVISNDDVEAPPAQTITEESYVNVSFMFNATDADGAGDLNNRSAYGWINRTGQATRSNFSCAVVSVVNSTTLRYNCTVQLWYFDGDGIWSINATINDSGGSRAERVSRTFTVNPTKGTEVAPTGITWASINLGNTNVLSGDDPIRVNNTANVNLTVINVTGYNLHGVTTPAQFIYAANFSVNINDACEGQALANNTRTTATNAAASPGNLSVGSGTAQEDLYFCLENIEGPGGSLSVQTYRTVSGFPWDITVG